MHTYSTSRHEPEMRSSKSRCTHIHTCVHHSEAAATNGCHAAAAVALSDSALHSDRVWKLLLQHPHSLATELGGRCLWGLGGASVLGGMKGCWGPDGLKGDYVWGVAGGGGGLCWGIMFGGCVGGRGVLGG